MSTTDQNQKRHNQQYQDMQSRFNKILVIGLGQVGLSVAKYVKERGRLQYIAVLPTTNNQVVYGSKPTQRQCR
jgi:UDP-N-acetylmuramoylalanine-D-glutamate ligase